MQIRRGRILAQRFFDIAEGVNLVEAELLVRELSRRPRFVGSARHIELPNPPLETILGARDLILADLPVTDVVVRIYDVGALVVTFVLALPNPTDPEAMIGYSSRISAAEDAITHAARPVAQEIATAILPACKPSDMVSNIIEDYTVFYIQETSPNVTGQTLGDHLDMPRLLAADEGPIAPQERQNLVHAAYSYRPDDLVVVDWNSAIVLDPTGGQEVPELLELTVMQMLELRTYDGRVGRGLDRLYKELETEERAFFRGSNYTMLSRRIMQMYVDVIEITERIDNSLTFLGDTWLARLHAGAAVEFGIPKWQKQLRNKLEVLHQINTLLVDQITSQKTMRIEVAIVGLILIEVLMAIFRVAV
jgi:hypothetical protein